MNTAFQPIHIDEIPVAQTLYLEVGARAFGNGSKSSPLIVAGGDLDSVNFSGSSLKLVFGVGRFFTSGFALPLSTCVIVGQGVDKTTIQLKDNTDSVRKNRTWPHLRVISDFGQYCLNYGMRDITIDCNWRGQQEAATNGNFKIEALHLLTVRGKYERIDVVDAGCHGSKILYPAGLECFPIGIQTCSMGPPFDKYLPEHKSRGEEPASFIEVSQCRILSATFLGGGYCTGIFVVTNQPGQGDRLPKGARSTLSAWVHDNYIENINGIAFGCAHSEHVLFERNHAVGNKCGFNCDTGRNENISLQDNLFLGNSHGINFSPDGGGDELSVEGNTIINGPRSTNPITGAPEGYIGLSIGNTLNAVSEGNILVGPADWVATKFTDYPIHADDTKLTIGGGPAHNPDLTNQLNQATARNEVLMKEAAAAHDAKQIAEATLTKTQWKLAHIQNALKASFAATEVLVKLNSELP